MYPHTNSQVIDGDITPQERRAVELLIQNEAARNNTNQPHPLVDQILPLHYSSNSSLMRDIERYELENGEEVGEGILEHTISMDRYTDFEGENGVDYNRVYTTLSYSIMRERSASLMSQNQQQLENMQRAHSSSLSELDNVYLAEVGRKRLRVDEINEIRKKRQLEFEPMNRYLEQRFDEGVNSMIDLGIESLEHK